MSLGFSKAGYNILAGLDNWDTAIETYRQNFKHPAIITDLKDVGVAIDILTQYNPEMIIGGPPCQDFSSAGKRDENNGRGDLTISYAEIVSYIKPQWFVMENVSRIVKTRKLLEAKAILRNAGYGMTQCVIDASLCGVPQRRKRFFLIGKMGANDGFLLPFIEKNLTDKPMTIKDYFGDDIDIDHYYRHPRSYARRGIFSVHEPSPTIRGVNRPIPDGYKIHPGDPVNSLDGIRELTTEERSRIQTFPSSFKFLGNKTAREQMIGNAVPVNLAYYVGKSILEYILFKKRQDSAVSSSDHAYWETSAVQDTLFDSQSPYISQKILTFMCPDHAIRWTTENMAFCAPDSDITDIEKIKKVLLYDRSKAIVGCYETGRSRIIEKKELKMLGIPDIHPESDKTTKYRIINLLPLTNSI